MLVDRSSESIFGTPYNDLRGDDECHPLRDRLIGPEGARTAQAQGRDAL